MIRSLDYARDDIFYLLERNEEQSGIQGTSSKKAYTNNNHLIDIIKLSVIETAMDSLTYTFNSTTREQLAEFIRGIFERIAPTLFTEGKLPFIVTTDGPPRMGKSMIWDESKSQIIGTNAELIIESSKGENSERRGCETWQGKHFSTKELLQIFFCNVGSRSFTDEIDGRITAEKIISVLDKIIEELKTPDSHHQAALRELGDIIFINQGHLQSSGIHPNLGIYVGSEETDLIHKPPTDGNWERYAKISLFDRRLQEDQNLITYLEAHCERL